MNTNEQKQNHPFDLEDRTHQFGINIINFLKKVPVNVITTPLISQCVRSGTSVGANYCEADDAETGKDFKHKIGICKKEARETRHWLRLVVVAVPQLASDAAPLIQESKELNLIFNSIVRKYNSNNH